MLSQVERALQKWIDAEKKDIKFDASREHWKGVVPPFNVDGYMAKTQLYYKSVQNVTEKKWAIIIEGAEKLVKPGKRAGHPSAGSQSYVDKSDGQDGRALLIELDTDEDNMSEDQ